jgi:hypothetical protein
LDFFFAFFAPFFDFFLVLFFAAIGFVLLSPKWAPVF